jgi:hypothetical protein
MHGNRSHYTQRNPKIKPEKFTAGLQVGAKTPGERARIPGDCVRNTRENPEKMHV